MAGWHCGGEASTTEIRLLLLHHSQTARAIHPHSLCNQSSGIGRGGIKEKKFTQPKDGRLDDEVTPTGLFTVDVIMSEDGTHDAVSDVVRERYKDDARYGEFITHEGGLNRLFKNMNALDFNRDAYADNAYGKAYFGLNVAGTEAEDAKKIRLSWQGLCYSKWCWVKTGPKMTIHFVDGTEQVGWHSVAIHGTNRRDKLGRASSGGAVYIKSDVIASIFETKHLQIGSLVKIADEAFLSPTHPFLPYVAPHLSHIPPFILVFIGANVGTRSACASSGAASPEPMRRGVPHGQVQGHAHQRHPVQPLQAPFWRGRAMGHGERGWACKVL